MPPVVLCPDLQSLQQLVEGLLPADAAESLENHLLECGRCIETICNLEENDTLVEAIQGKLSQMDKPDEEMVQSLIERFRTWKTEKSATDSTIAPNPLPESSVQKSTEDLSFLAPPQQDDEIGRLGDYRILKILGSGGMGLVFEAEDVTLNRMVALKVMKPRLAARKEARQRFLLEARATAAIQHDNIVNIFQVGDDNSVPYLAMQLLEGQSLHEMLESGRRLLMKQILRIGRETAAGLAAAHAKGLIHRDIKPSNLWIEPEQGGRVKIVDFGLARSIPGPGEETIDDVRLTQSGMIVGTPAYMAPEQGRSEEIDHRCDLFSLGCVLYQLCTGEMPFKGHNITGIMWSLANYDPPSPESINPDVPSALAEVIMKLLRKEPSERVQTARDVINELKKIEMDLATQPQRAKKSLLETTKSGNRRRWLPIGIAAGFLIAAIGAAAYLGGVILFRVETEKGTVIVKSFDPNIEITIRRNGKKVGDYELKHGPVETSLRTGEIEVVIKGGELDGVIVKNGKFQLTKGNEILVEIIAASAGQVRPFAGLKSKDIAKAQLAIAGDGDPNMAPEGLVAILGDGRLRHWSHVTCVAYSTDGKYIASGSLDRTVALWNARTHELVARFHGHTAAVRSVAMSHDGKFIASASDDNSVILWSVETRKPIHTLKGHQNAVLSVSLSKDGNYVASASKDQTVIVWDTMTGRKVQTFDKHTDVVNSVAFHPDGNRLASASDDGTVRVWNVNQVQHVTVPGEKLKWKCVAFRPDGKWLAASSQNGAIVLWETVSGKQVHSLRKRTGYVGTIMFSPDGQRLAAGSGHLSEKAGSINSILVFDLLPNKVLFRKEYDFHVNAVCYSPDGQKLVTASRDETIRIHDAASGNPAGRLSEGHTGLVRAVAMSADQKSLVSASWDQTIRIWDTANGKQLASYRGKSGFESLCAHPKRNLLAAASYDGYVRYFDIGNLQILRKVIVSTWDPVVAISPDGKRLAVAPERLERTAIRISDIENTKQSVRKLRGHTEPVGALTFSSDSKMLISGCDDNTVRLWNANNGSAITALTGHTDDINSVAISPDGKLFASASVDKTVKIWDVSKREEVHTFRGHSDGVNSVAFAPNGKLVLSAGGDGRVLMWDIKTRRFLRRWHAPGDVRSVEFSRDGKHIVTGNGNGTIYVIRLAEAPVDPTANQNGAAQAQKLADKAKPFVIIEKGSRKRWEYEQLSQALTLFRDGDTIEVHGNGPFELHAVTVYDRSLTIKAAPGYRPQFVNAKGIEEHQWISWNNGTLKLIGCDFRFTPSKSCGQIFYGIGGKWKFEDCRFLSSNAVFVSHSGPELHVTNCLISIHGGEPSLFTARPKKGESSNLVLTNNVIRGKRFFYHTNCEGSVAIHLHDNSFLLDFFLFEVGNNVKQPIVAVAERNVFITPSGVIYVANSDVRAQFRWNGANNLYVGDGSSPSRRFPLPAIRQMNGKPAVLVSGLSAWNKFWKRKEKGSQAVADVQFAWSKTRQQTPSAKLNELHYDPLQWRLLPTSPGYSAGPGGRDFGADVERIAVTTTPKDP